MNPGPMPGFELKDFICLPELRSQKTGTKPHTPETWRCHYPSMVQIPGNWHLLKKPFEGQTKERVGCKNAWHLWALQDRHQVATELSHRVLRWVCPSILARGVLTPLTHADSHRHSEGLSRFPLLGRSTARSCSRAETRIRIALGSSRPRTDANFSL